MSEIEEYINRVALDAEGVLPVMGSVAIAFSNIAIAQALHDVAAALKPPVADAPVETSVLNPPFPSTDPGERRLADLILLVDDQSGYNNIMAAEADLLAQKILEKYEPRRD